MEEPAPKRHRRADSLTRLPPTVVVPARVEVISLLESDSDDEPVVVVPPPDEPNWSSSNESRETQMQAVYAPEASRLLTTSSSPPACLDGDDVQATAILKEAIVYPHARADCRLFHFENATTDEAHEQNLTTCSKCYCYVCDVVASVCPVWNTHCMASDKHSAWRTLRSRFRAGTGGSFAISPSLLPPKLRGAVACNEFHSFITRASTSKRTRRPLRAPPESTSSSPTRGTLESSTQPQGRTFRTFFGRSGDGLSLVESPRVNSDGTSQLLQIARATTKQRRISRDVLAAHVQALSRERREKQIANRMQHERNNVPVLGREYVIEVSKICRPPPAHLRGEKLDLSYLIGKIDFWRPYCSHRISEIPRSCTRRDAANGYVNIVGEEENPLLLAVLLRELGVSMEDKPFWATFRQCHGVNAREYALQLQLKGFSQSESPICGFLSSRKRAIGSYVFQAIDEAIHASLISVRWEVSHYPGSDLTNVGGALGSYHEELVPSVAGATEFWNIATATHAWRKLCANRIEDLHSLNDENCCRLRAWIYLLPGAFGSNNVRIASHMAPRDSPYAFHSPLDGSGAKVVAPKDAVGTTTLSAAATSLIGKVLILVDFANFVVSGVTETPGVFLPKSFERPLMSTVFRGSVPEDCTLVANAEKLFRSRNALIRNCCDGDSRQKLFSIEGILSSPLFTVSEKYFAGRTDQPSSVTVNLRPYQLETLKWMENQEKRSSISETFWVKLPMLPFVKGKMQGKWEPFWFCPMTGNVATVSPPKIVGGLLAEEMGLGKTVEAIALICNTIDVARADALTGSGTADDPLYAKTTLIVTPVSLLKQWESELISRTSSKLSLCIWYGEKRSRDPNEIANFDVCLTTYSTLSNRKNDSPLHAIRFYRIIIDESTYIKGGATTNIFSSLMYVHSTRRWAVSGTPFSNDIKSFLAILRFLGVSPWASESLSNELFADFTNRQSHEIIRVRSDPSVLAAVPALAFAHVLKSIMMRHVKSQLLDGRPLVDLPPSKSRLVNVRLTSLEHSTYEKIQNDILACTAHMLSDCEIVKRSIISLHANLLPLRMATSGIIRVRRDNSAPCPDGTNLYTTAPTQNAAKLQQVLRDIHDIRKSDPVSKFVIFSEFDPVRQELKRQLTIAGIGHSSVEGHMTATARGRILREFNDNMDQVAMILSYKLAHGLTLTCANTVMLLDPSLSQEAELQAFHRVWRIGQTRPVQVLTYIALGTIDERIIQIRIMKGQPPCVGAASPAEGGNEKLPHAVIFRKLFGSSENSNGK